MPSDRARDDHGDNRDDHKMIKCSTWKRRKRDIQDQGKGIAQVFSFGDQDTIEGVIIFRIDSSTIKRGILWLRGYRVPLGVIVHVHAFRTQ